jgi:hypothetical protein
MLDYEGSRSEFLKLLVEMGEEPAFLARARAPQEALEGLLRACEAKRVELLRWPRFHLAALARRVADEWVRLDPLLASREAASQLQTLRACLAASESGAPDWLTTDRAALRQLVESVERYNRKWQAYVDGLDLEPVNQPRRDFNQYYVLEKACAFGSEGVAEGFEPLPMIDRADLYRRYPLLTAPRLA